MTFRSSASLRGIDMNEESVKSLLPEVFGAVRVEEVNWAPFLAFPPKARLAILVGNPQKAGLYVIRVRLPGGTKMMPHAHQEDRIYTVISGVFYVGRGDQFDAEALTAYAPGSVIVLPGNTHHFHWAKSGDYITQVYGYGPLSINYLSAEDDPRQHP